MFLEKTFNGIHVFRDDLFPFLGGGNKGRKMVAIGNEITKLKAKALVTTGGIQSNHCRAVAVYAAQHQLKCTLVLHGSKNAFYTENGNAKIIRDTNVVVEFVTSPEEIGPRMDIAMKNFENTNDKPYYIYGGGHNLAGGNAYINAVEELMIECQKINWFPEYIFLASGTGSTQAGIMAGLDKFKFYNTKVVGISIARNTVKAKPIITDFYNLLINKNQINPFKQEPLIVDDFLMGGYGKSSDELNKLSKDSLKTYGFTLDTCYTAKAFYGMTNYIKQNKIDNKAVLFWHTGGFLNYLAE